MIFTSSHYSPAHIPLFLLSSFLSDGDLWGGGRGDVDGRWSLLSVLDLELDSLILGQGLESLLLDGAEMDEDILGAVARGDEAESLGLVEPLDLSLDFIRHSD